MPVAFHFHAVRVADCYGYCSHHGYRSIIGWETVAVMQLQNDTL